MSAIRLWNGRMIDPWKIEDYDFTAHDFIHSLSLLNRYTGHSRFPYSVAEHSVLLAGAPQVRELGLRRAALLHDFNEALTNDIPHPYKKELTQYCEIEERVQRHIFMCFGEPWENMERLKEFDRRICADEMQQILFTPYSIGLEPLGIEIPGWHWEVAKLMLYLACQDEGIVYQ